jgi:signal transduction histidine kinase/ligand-binding sensor domain-containing protein
LSLPWKINRLLAALVAVCAGLLTATARAEPQYRFDLWTVDNGLPQNIVRGIAQTPDGYLWIATLDGLARFDGARFTVFNKSNTPGIASNRFTSLVEDRDGDLWMVTESGGLTRYHRGAFHTYGAEDGIPSNSVRGIAEDNSGKLWILAEESISLWNKTTGELRDTTPDSLRMHYQSLRWGNAGFWGVDGAGLHVFTGGRFASHPLPGWLTAKPVWGVGFDAAGALWIENSDGKQAMVAAGSQTVERVEPAHPREITYRDPHQHRWSMHVGPRMQRYLDFVSSGEKTSIPVDGFLEDREGNVWVGTEGRGLYRLQEQSVRVYSKAQGLSDSDIYPIYQDRAGAIWMGAWQTGLSKLSDGKFANYSVAQGLPSPLVTALTEDRDGNIWVATQGSLTIFRDGHFRRATGIVLPEHATAQALLQDRGGTLWIGTSNGLVLYRDGPSKTLTVQDGLATNDVRVIVESRSGDIWIGGYGGLTRLHGGQFSRWSERDGLPSDNIRTIYEDGGGTIWLGSYDGGLGRLKDGKFTRYSERDGLFNNGVFQILEDGRGNLWMSSNRGIYRVSKQELNAFADGKLPSITAVAYGQADGMLNVECNGGLWPAGIRARDGSLWFPTQDGAAVIDPNTVRINPQPPPVVIENALVDREPATISDGNGGAGRPGSSGSEATVLIPPGRQNLEIAYTALSFVHSEQIRFRYRLEGLDTDWVDAGSRRVAYYSHLPSGSYHFKVIARNSDGVWNEAGQTLTIMVLAPFYQRWWFTTLVTLLLAAVAGLAVRFRLKQLEEKQALQKAFSQQLIASQEHERQRIAAELHDSLGQRLVVINNLALFSIHSRNKAPEGAQTALKEISDETSLAIQETREISYNLRPFQLDRLGLTKAVQGILRTVAAASGLEIRSEVDAIDDVFAKDLQINFYRIVQESLNNVMKHAQASKVRVRVVRDTERVVLTIEDNGVGLAASNRPARSGKSGFGMTGMEERANSLGGVFRISSAPGQGTVMTVEIPVGDTSHE